MSFIVTLHGSGNCFEAPADGNILAAGLKAGYMLPYNCRSGLCRTCKSRIIDGAVDYPDKPLTSYLSADDIAAGYALICQAHARSNLVIDANELRDLATVQPVVMPCRVTELTRLAPDVMRVKLRLPMNGNLRYLPGQHVSILLDGGARRDYSIASPCRAAGVTELELHIRHIEGGLFTDRVFTEMKPRTLLKVEVPLGSFFVRAERDAPIIFLATSTGFAPVKAMMEQLLVSGTHKTRPVHLYWGARTRADLYLNDLAEKWARDSGICYIPVLSRPTRACGWTGRTGHIQEHVLADHPDLTGHEIYACGSPRMVRDARDLVAAHRGVDPANFFADEFLTAADQADQPG